MRTGKLRVTIHVLAVTGLAMGVVGWAAYRVGTRTEAALRIFDPRRNPTVDEANVIYPIEYALRSREDRNDLIFVGDSACHTGIDPQAFEKLTGLRSFNLASIRGLGPRGFLITMMAYLAQHPRPRAVVLCVSPFCFEVAPSTLGGPLPKRFAANYGPQVQGLEPMAENLAYFAKQGALSALKAAGRDVRDDPLTGLESETYRTLESKMRASRGFFPLKGLHGPGRGIPRPDAKLVHADWDQGVRQIADACDRAGVTFLLRFAPITAEGANARDFGALESWSRELESTHRRMAVARPIVIAFDPRFMWDSIHLNSAGVEKFMPVIAQEVQAALAQPAK